ncbi:MAG: prephenate dehydrogenase/arogenate dehydrogenase family protein [bacterium]
MATFFERVAILGVGLLGGSLGLALRSRDLARHVVGIGRNPERLDKAVHHGAVTETCLFEDKWPEEISLLVMAAPVERIGILLRTYRSKIPAETIITDVGSTKARLVSVCEEILGPGHRFVGSHPMAGSHNTGVEYAHEDLFQNRVCIVTPTPQTNIDVKTRVIDLWRSIGSSVIELSPEEHDQLVARTSHLPHLTAAALCLLVGKSPHPCTPDLAGSGFRDTTRLAAGDPGMWSEICQHNRKEIAAAISELVDELSHLRNHLDNGDFEAISQFLEKAQIHHNQLCGEDKTRENEIGYNPSQGEPQFSPPPAGGD